MAGPIKVLVANRGEIAVRIIRSAKELGIETVAIYAEPDRGALHTRIADNSLFLGGSRALDTYLDQDKILLAAIQSGATLVHPGYGFLAENAEFAGRVEKEGLVLVGPPSSAIKAMGDKEVARSLVVKRGVPVLPGTESGLSYSQFKKEASRIGYPVLVKAAAGGSGRGMRVVRAEHEAEAKLREAASEAEAAFANPSVFLEKYIVNPRHIEVQVFAGPKGELLHFGDRECSIQRRHQKLVEEAPAPRLHPVLRKKLWKAALDATRSVDYKGAGTVEFLVSGGEKEDDSFYFLEMNTRIQVEHTVSEEITGVDLLRLQFETALEKPLQISQDDIQLRGAAIQFRIYAEDPAENFKPNAGKIKYMSRALGPGVREDTWVEPGVELSPYFDSLISKLILKAENREVLLKRSKAVLADTIIDGLPNTLGFHRWLLRQGDFLNARTHIHWLENNYQGQIIPASSVGPLNYSISGASGNQG